MAASPSTAASASVAASAAASVAASAAASTAPSAAASAEASAAAKPFDGQTVVVQTTEGVEYSAFKDLLPAFTEKTGIKVEYNFVDPTAYQDKLPIQLAAHDSSFDVFFIGSENLPKYVAQGVVENIKPYIDDTNATPASWNYEDVLKTARDVCTGADGAVYCVGTHLGASMLFYNKKMYADAGITAPPQTMDELLANSLKITSGDKYGFCMRGDKTQNLLDPIFAWGYWLPWQNGVTGFWFDKDGSTSSASRPMRPLSAIGIATS